MDVYGKIAQKVKAIAAKSGMGSIIFPAKVVSASGNTCAVDVGGLVISDVRLKAVVDSNTNELIVTPEKDSYVLVADLSGGNYRQLAVISYSEVDSISIKIGESSLLANKDGFVFNGGINGAVDITKLVSWMTKVKADLTAISTAFNGLGIPITPTTPAAVISDFEDKKIKH
jgi:hypothetical protein